MKTFSILGAGLLLTCLFAGFVNAADNGIAGADNIFSTSANTFGSDNGGTPIGERVPSYRDVYVGSLRKCTAWEKWCKFCNPDQYVYCE